ncbi:DUF1822 family protein [Oscillatoria salina]|uniref:DUF1822 family protein n=1 Tax=Oscillatoria salina TaxID=331517 RepID=UPI0013B78CCE|nr:DUF1822 family protein [Oscillatoria salina]MBZ8182961.1 DUF1822 family protein [Oscillatoria salina IIICB1]NET86532.1 DUF1822 family protein [Kamptonema sp. SIO1D9]
MNNTETCLTIPLVNYAHNQAREFAAQQATPEKGLRVYLNTLAVWAVRRYLQWLQIDSDLEASDSWHPGMRAIFDIADLVIPNLGRLECRPVLAEETVLRLPPEVVSNRIGYLAVGFNRHPQQAQLLGFVPEVNSETISLTELQPLDALIEHLEQVSLTFSAPSQEQKRNNLSQWWEGVFESGWQAVEGLFTLSAPNLAFRRTCMRMGKLIELGSECQLILVLTLVPETNDKVGINLQLYPARATKFAEATTAIAKNQAQTLPTELKLLVLTASGEVFREITPCEGDTFLQYEFAGQLGEEFSIKVTLLNASFSEAFVI